MEVQHTNTESEVNTEEFPYAVMAAVSDIHLKTLDLPIHQAIGEVRRQSFGAKEQ